MGKTTIITKETKNSTNQEPEIAEEPSADEIELAEFMGNIPGGVQIKIFKSQDGEMAYCGKAEPAAVNEDYLFRHFGGGRYYLRGTKNGKYITGAHKQITIYEPEANPAEITGFSAPEPKESTDTLALLLAQMNRQHETVLELIKSQGNGQKTEMSDLISLAQIINNQNKGQDATAGLPAMVDLFKTVLETSRDLTGGEDPKMSWAKFGMQVLEKLPGTVGQILGAKGIPIRPDNGQGEAPPEQVEAMLAQGIAWLKKKAENGADPQFQANVILDNMDNPMYKAVAIQLSNMPFDDFGKIDPEIIKPPLRAWFVECYNTLHQGLNYDDNDQIEIITGPSRSPANNEGNEEADNSGDTQPSAAQNGASDN